MTLFLYRAPHGTLRAASCLLLATTTLLFLRQIHAVRELQAARAELEARVRQRTEALERAQTTLLRTEKLNTLALMGAGVAHDLNNLLTSVCSSAELAAGHMAEGIPPHPAALRRIVATAEQAAQLTKRLMGYARPGTEALGLMDLGAEIQEIEPTLRLLLPRTVHLRLEPALAAAPLVLGSRPRLEQMLVNLVVNARDAMPEGGTITVRFGAGDGGAVIEVADTGTGIAPELHDRIFELFFTTKPEGRGTGMGLPSLKALVEETGGSIRVESEAGRGSRFRILLPAA
jgi:signal transduction histidine kinase